MFLVKRCWAFACCADFSSGCREWGHFQLWCGFSLRRFLLRSSSRVRKPVAVAPGIQNTGPLVVVPGLRQFPQHGALPAVDRAHVPRSLSGGFFTRATREARTFFKNLFFTMMYSFFVFIYLLATT